MWQDTKNIYHWFQAILALLLYRFPGRGMTIIGVTGTDGKTTTANLLYHILQQAGHKTALISTLGAVIDGKDSDLGFHITTPGRFAVQSYLKQAKKAGAKYVVLEVTSHSLHQHRVFGIPFAVGVVTNINKEHLDYHKTYERYVHAKAKLLKKAKVAVINKDDQSYQRLKKIELKNRDKKIVTYGFKKDADVNLHNFPFTTKLLGKFNKYNCLAATAALQQVGIPDSVIRKGIATFKAPEGRQEIVYDKDFMVMIDFAHTPQSFNSILPEMKHLAKKRLIHVFGSAGKRDAIKRPEMGKIASQYDDVIVLTAEDPRGEPVEKINHDIIAGIKSQQFGIMKYANKQDMKLKDEGKYIIPIPDRKEAIEFAISLAKKGDVLILTGKSHEKSMNYGKGEEAWSEYDAVKEALKARQQK